MAPVMALRPDLLLDTHIVISMAIDPDRIPVSVLEAIEGARRRFVSHISALEIQVKHEKSPKEFGFALEFYEAAMKEFALEELPLTYSDIKAMKKMEFLHRDPFDRILMTHAVARNLLFVTQDKDIIRTAKKFKGFHLITG